MAVIGLLWVNGARPAGVFIGNNHFVQGVPKAPVVFIGTSLLLRGLAPTGQDQLGDGREHARLASSNLSAPQALGLARLVLAESAVRTLVLEVNPFVRSFAKEWRLDAPITGPVGALHWVQHLLFDIRCVATGWLKAQAGQPSMLQDLMQDPPARGRESAQTIRAQADWLYPMTVHEPHDWAPIEALIRQARQQGCEVVFLMPPRSALAARLQGMQALAALDAQAEAFAARLGVRLIKTAEVWPDELFLDSAHLNLQGRERWRRELKASGRAAHGI
jgi:hypothetical protein